jgi:predicted amidohydrolase YtcJ
MKSTSSNLISFVNARVLTPNGSRIVSITTTDGMIRSVRPGHHSQIRNGKIVDMKGRIVLPGLIDCHIHLFDLAFSEDGVNLFGSSSIEEIKERIRKYLASEPRRFSRKDRWVIGRGWEQDKFSERRFPSKEDLDEVVAENPAIMVRICGHVAVLNSVALEMLQRRGTRVIPDRDLLPTGTDGLPTGLVKEAALGKTWALVPQPPLSEYKTMFLRAQAACIRRGISGAHCILSGEWKKELRSIAEIEKEGNLKIRLVIFLPVDSLKEFEMKFFQTKRGSLTLPKGERFAVRGFKLFADGSLGARTAALSNPYDDDPGTAGILNYTDEEIIDISKRVKQLGAILASHAIGDRAVEQLLRCYETAGIKKRDGFRIEHCSVVRRDLLNRLRSFVISVQPGFLITDHWIEKRLGRKRARWAYAFRSIRKNSTMVFGSDAPSDNIDPFRSLRAATQSGRTANESISLNESLDAYSLVPAQLDRLTQSMGSIAKGKACDLVVLSAASIGSVLNGVVEETIIDGISEYSKTS